MSTTRSKKAKEVDVDATEVDVSILKSLQSKMEQLLLSNKEQTKKLDQVLTRMSAVEMQVNANRKT